MSFFDRELKTVALLAAALVVAVQAAPAAAARTSSASAQAGAKPDAAADKRARSAQAKRKPAKLEAVDDLAFTITEQTRVSGEARSQYDNALRLLAQERYEQGIAALLDVVAKAPDVTAPYIDLGIAYKRIGNFEQAEANLNKALELNPNHPVAYDELGLLYRETGRFKDARASYEKALAITPGFHFAHRNLAILCDIYLDDLPCALDHYEAYSRAEPDDKDVAKWIADLRKRLGR